MEAFVYCWTDHKTGMLYVGSHVGSIDDGYICSSRYMMEEYNIRPNDFTRQIVATGKESDIRSLETKILKSCNAKLDEMFYNRCNAEGIIGFSGGNKNPMKNKTTLKRMLKNRQKTMLSKYGVDHNWKTKQHSEAMSSKISKLNSSQISCPHCSKIGGHVNMKRYHFNNCKEKENNHVMG